MLDLEGLREMVYGSAWVPTHECKYTKVVQDLSNLYKVCKSLAVSFA